MGCSTCPHPKGHYVLTQDRSDKDFYLSKKYTKARLDHYLDGENDPT